MKNFISPSLLSANKEKMLDEFDQADLKMYNNKPLKGYNRDQQLTKFKEKVKGLNEWLNNFIENTDEVLHFANRYEYHEGGSGFQYDYVGNRIIDDEKFRNDLIKAFPTNNNPNMLEGFTQMIKDTDQGLLHGSTSAMARKDFLGSRYSPNAIIENQLAMLRKKGGTEAKDFESALKVLQNEIEFAKIEEYPENISDILGSILRSFENFKKQPGYNINWDTFLEDFRKGKINIDGTSSCFMKGYEWWLGKVFYDAIDENKKALSGGIALIDLAK